MEYIHSILQKTGLSLLKSDWSNGFSELRATRLPTLLAYIQVIETYSQHADRIVLATYNAFWSRADVYRSDASQDADLAMVISVRNRVRQFEELITDRLPDGKVSRSFLEQIYAQVSDEYHCKGLRVNRRECSFAVPLSTGNLELSTFIDIGRRVSVLHHVYEHGRRDQQFTFSLLSWLGLNGSTSWLAHKELAAEEVAAAISFVIRNFSVIVQRASE